MDLATLTTLLHALRGHAEASDIVLRVANGDIPTINLAHVKV